MRWCLCFLFFVFGAFAALEKKQYSFSTDPIDVVIPCAAKDKEYLELCIDSIRKYGNNIRRVIVVSRERLTEKAEWFAESRYPFSKEDLVSELRLASKKRKEKLLTKKGSRIGWIYQQFLKLYAPYVIPDISPNVLILDADVVFIQPVSFMDEQGAPFFNVGTEYHQPYFDHMNRLLPDLKRVYPDHSGITHHMLFQKPVLDDLFSILSKRHRTDPWRAICHVINPKEVSCLSEYEIYFNFIFLRTDQAKIRPLSFIDVKSFDKIEKYQKKGHAYITSHQRP